ncbi:DUF4386 domain-containing protein [Halocola ammonii]
MKNMNTTARLTGLGYLIIFLTGFFANFYTLESLVVSRDATTTALNIASNQSLYEMGVAAFTLMVLVDIILAFPLYQLLKSVNEKLARLSSALRLINGAVFAVALISLYRIALLAKGGAETLETTVMPLIQNFDAIWNLGLLFFGVHLLLLGWLIFKAINFPKIIGLFLLVAGAGYLIDSGARLYLPSYDQFKDIFEMIVVIPGVVGEFSLTLWLLIKGTDRKKVKASKTRSFNLQNQKA